MKIIKFLSSEDAVSEVLDFVTILGILVLSIGIIGVAGYPMLKSAQEAQQIENTRQGFIVLAENINKIVLGQTPSQSVELKMYGGTLSVTGSSTINITATGYNSSAIPPGNENITLVPTMEMRSIESTVGDTTIAYEGTGVWAKYPNGKTLLIYSPLITNQSNVLVIPVVTVWGTSSRGGSGIVRVVAYGTPSVTSYHNVSNIVMTLNSSYWDGWGDYFQNVMSWNYCTADGGSGTCTIKLETMNNIDVYILDIELYTSVV